MEQRSCHLCGGVFVVGSHNQKFYSLRCSEKNRNASGKRALYHTLWGRRNRGYRQRFPKLKVLNRRVSKCIKCQELFEVKVAGGTRCCGDCRGYKSRLKPTKCLGCDSVVLAGVRGRYCDRCKAKSKAESKAEANARRRARIKGSVKISKVKRARVYERDHWVCGICDEPVDQTLRFPHPMSASLDHVVPLAHRGAHDEANLQLAHLICNSIKCDGVHVARR
jgi:hypothetical protein